MFSLPRALKEGVQIKYWKTADNQQYIIAHKAARQALYDGLRLGARQRGQLLFNKAQDLKTMANCTKADLDVAGWLGVLSGGP